MTLSGISATPTEPCPACNGQGFWKSWAWRGRGEILVDCWDCDATGRIPAETMNTREKALADVERSFA